MASKCQWAKLKQGNKYKTREVNRCKLCGRDHGYHRVFGICRLCLRELALRGELPGVVKASW